ncbi:MAG: hypothetical protein JOS17DRAFT_588018 [Linnemannia elongata]|nr:MAG: hypothetical protein JOS17DRAFT_588018 [Linnemannia elongata]
MCLSLYLFFFALFFYFISSLLFPLLFSPSNSPPFPLNSFFFVLLPSYLFHLLFSSLPFPYPYIPSFHSHHLSSHPSHHPYLLSLLYLRTYLHIIASTLVSASLLHLWYLTPITCHLQPRCPFFFFSRLLDKSLALTLDVGESAKWMTTSLLCLLLLFQKELQETRIRVSPLK